MTSTTAHPYDALTPDRVLDALASVGLSCDGRLMPLSSYENRVYQLWLEDEFQGHRAVVAKFYRPGRWSRAQILEEHAFAAELVEGEVPAVAPLVLEGGTLNEFGGFSFSCWPANARSSRSNWAHSSTATSSCGNSTAPNSHWSSRCAPCGSFSTARGWRGAGRTRSFRSIFRSSAAATTGKGRSACSRNRSRPWRNRR